MCTDATRKFFQCKLIDVQRSQFLKTKSDFHGLICATFLAPDFIHGRLGDVKTRLMHEWHLPAVYATPYMCHTLYVPHPTCATPYMCHTLHVPHPTCATPYMSNKIKFNLSSIQVQFKFNSSSKSKKIQSPSQTQKSRPESNTLDM